MNTPAAAQRLGMSVSFLNQARMKGTGPRYLKIGGRVRYRPEDIDAWLGAQARNRVWNFDGEVE